MLKKSSNEEQHHLEDRGWQAMRVLLDQEMPVKRKRRPIIWWPVGIAAAIMIAAGLFWINPDQGGKSMLEVAQHNKTGTDRESELSDPQRDANGNLKEAEISHLEITPKSPVEQHQKLTRSDLALAKNLGQSNPVDQEHHQPFVKDQRQESDSQLGNQASDQIETVKNGDSYTGEPSEEVEILPTKKKHHWSSIAMLSFRDVYVSTEPYPLSLLSTAIADEGNVNIQNPRRRTWDALVGGGLLADRNFNHLSWDVSTTLRFKLLKRWAVGLGVAFWEVRKQHQVYYDPSVSNQFNIYGDRSSLDQQSEPERFDSSQGFVSSSSRFNLDVGSYLRVPIFAQYNPDGRWQPYVGITPIFFIRTQKLEPVITQGSTGQLQSPPDLVRKQNLSVDVGIAYVVTGHFRLQLSYLYGFRTHLTGEFSSGSFSNLHRTFRLAAEYEF